MFNGVNEKIERAEYFLNCLKKLEAEFGALSAVSKERSQEMRANVDGFFFELVSAKDFFLQGINDTYHADLPRDEATNIKKLKSKLGDTSAVEVVESIEKLMSNTGSWLWKINNYRNSAIHRELAHFGFFLTLEEGVILKAIDNMKKQGAKGIKVTTKEKKKEVPPDYVTVEPKEIKVYLFKDPEKPQEGCADIEVIPYLDKSIKQMRTYLHELYGRLETA